MKKMIMLICYLLHSYNFVNASETPKSTFRGPLNPKIEKIKQYQQKIDQMEPLIHNEMHIIQTTKNEEKKQQSVECIMHSLSEYALVGLAKLELEEQAKLESAPRYTFCNPNKNPIIEAKKNQDLYWQELEDERNFEIQQRKRYYASRGMNEAQQQEKEYWLSVQANVAHYDLCSVS